MKEVENKTINPTELLDVFCEENCQNKWVCDANAQKCPTYLLLRKWIERMENKNGKIDVKEEDEGLEEQEELKENEK